MTTALAIEVLGLSKNFKLYSSRWVQLTEQLVPGSIRRVEDNWVLRDVSFAVAKGECVGIIGRNGSGKSTLLKLVTGSLHPTAGRVAVAGRILGLLELGTGFNLELTGRENVVLSTQLQGLPGDYAARHMTDIEAFAEIGAFFERPVKTYSSGMFVRLAFATFMFMQPDVFIVDEALSVGDLFFQQKCFDAIAGMKARGTTFLFVSHDMSVIRNLCDRAIVLNEGRIDFDGNPSEAVMRYYLAHQPPASVAPSAPASGHATVRPIDEVMRARSILTFGKRMGSMALEIQAVRCVDDQGQDRLQFRMNETLNIEILVRANAPIMEPNVGFELYDRFNMLVYGVSLLNLGKKMPPLAATETRMIRFAVTLSAMPGEYALSVATAEQARNEDPNAGQFLDRHEQLGPVLVSWDRSLMPFYGLANLMTTCEVT